MAGCGVLGAPAGVWKSIVASLLGLTKVFRWVDDNLVIKRPTDRVSLADIENLSRGMGVKTNPVKNHDFSTEQKYIGFIWNGAELTVRLPEEKLEQRREQVVKILSEDTMWTKLEIEAFVGRLNHTVYVVPHMACYLNACYRWIKEWKNSSARRKTPEDVKEDLQAWKLCLESFKNHRLIPDMEPTEVGWVGDAAESFGIGVLIGNFWTCFKVRPGWNDPDRNGIRKRIPWLETVAIRLGLLLAQKVLKIKGQAFIVWTDNTTSEGALRNQKSKDRTVNEEWKVIQRLLTQLQCNVVPKRVKSKDNRADQLSRGELGPLCPEFQVRLALPDDLIGLLECVSPPR